MKGRPLPHRRHLVLVVHPHPRRLCRPASSTRPASAASTAKLARIVNEQGRVAVGRAGVPARTPTARASPSRNRQSLDFAAMDLSEFYASMVPTLPSVGTIQGSNASRLTTCYYGQGNANEALSHLSAAR